MSDLGTAVRGFVIETVKTSVLNKIFGGGSAIPAAYKVSIIASDKTGIVSTAVYARLQKEFSLETSSHWETFMGGGAGVLANAIAQAGFGTSLQLAVTSRRIWMGTKPLAISLPLVFMAETNVEIDVINFCKALQKMALPSIGTFGVLIPPGPSPFINTAGILENNFGTQISVQIGNFIKFDNVIIKEVKVDYSGRMSASPAGKPMYAEVLVTLETYEILTVEKLEEAYNLGAKDPMAGVTLSPPGLSEEFKRQQDEIFNSPTLGVDTRNFGKIR